MELLHAQKEFESDLCYLNSATVGLLPKAAREVIETEIEAWRRGRVDAVAYDQDVDRCRRAFAKIVGTQENRVAIGSQVSVATEVAVSALSAGDEVLLAEEDFTSILFPFLQAQEARGIRCRVVPLAELLNEVKPSTAMVAVSAVQSSDGRVLDLHGLAQVARDNDALTFVDATQAASWLPIDADRFDLVSAGAYKWMCCARGAAFLVVSPRIGDRITPVGPGWYAGEDRWNSVYRPPVRLATGARRFDVSPAWLSWAGGAPALELLADVGVEAIHTHDVALANAFRTGVGLEPSNSAIVSVDTPGGEEQLKANDIAFAGRDGRIRLSFHLYNTMEHVQMAIDALKASM